MDAESNINFDRVRTKLSKIARTNERGLQKLTIKNSRASTSLAKEDNTKVNSNGNTEASTTAPQASTNTTAATAVYRDKSIESIHSVKIITRLGPPAKKAVLTSQAKSPENVVVKTDKANNNIVIKSKINSEALPDERRTIVSTPKKRNLKKLDAQLQKGITIS